MNTIWYGILKSIFELLIVVTLQQSYSSVHLYYVYFALTYIVINIIGVHPEPQESRN